jgi:glycosyltransferase involved in cell wall biosynthesis
MRVLMLSKACVVGAYQTKLEELARLPGMDLTVVGPPQRRARSGTLRLEREHTQGYEMLVERIALNGSYHLHYYPGLGRTMRRIRPDLVHIDEEPYNLATAHALWLARRVGARSLFFSWQNILRRYPLPFRSFERYVLRHADCGIVGNQESEQVWRTKGFPGPLVVVPQFGVDPELYAPGTEPLEQDRGLTFGYVGRLVEEKGVDLLLDALAEIDGAWQALIVGGGPAVGPLQSQAQRLGVASRVTFRGAVPSGQMPAVYRSIDVLVLPSRTRPNWKEQFGRALVEAMACGVPVVGSDSGEIPQVVGDAGLVFAEGQAPALRQQLERLRGDEKLRSELSRRGRERVLAHYTQAQIATRTLAAYETALGSKSPRLPA